MLYRSQRELWSEKWDKVGLTFFFFLFNNQPDAPIIQIYSVIKLYMFRASYLPITRSFLLYIRHW